MVWCITTERGKKGYTAASDLSMQRQSLRSSAVVLTRVVDREPKFAGIARNRKFIDRSPDENV
jgi:hypothetical protein